jgi:hypothetical protein
MFQLFQEHMGVYSDGMKVAEKYAIDYRIERAEASVPAVIEVTFTFILHLHSNI